MNTIKKMRVKGFTLIELLVVIAIIGVLFAVALPVFENVGRKNTERSAFRVLTTLRLARQHAINKRQWTMVIFPNRDGGPYSGNDEDTIDKCLRSYAVVAATNNLDGIYKFDASLRDPRVQDMELTFVSDWKYLPEGIYFDDDETLNSNWLMGAKAGSSDTYMGQFRFPVDPTQPNNRVRPMGAILFKPNGRAFTMQDGSSKGYFWSDRDAAWLKQVNSIYVTSDKYYEEQAGALLTPKVIPGTNTIVQVRAKTGQAHIFDGIWD